jgi:ABC-type Co2+ transport system permease subunit
MDRSLIALVIVILAIAVFSLPVVRRSQSREKIHGGGLAQVFHFVAIAAYVGVVPAFLCGSILAGTSGFGLPVGFTLLIVCAVSLLAYAVIERPARDASITEDRGWTEEDARSSGL